MSITKQNTTEIVIVDTKTVRKAHYFCFGDSSYIYVPLNWKPRVMAVLQAVSGEEIDLDDICERVNNGK